MYKVPKCRNKFSLPELLRLADDVLIFSSIKSHKLIENFEQRLRCPIFRKYKSRIFFLAMSISCCYLLM